MNSEFRIAERQHGVITRAQLVDTGLSHSQIDRRILAGRLDAMHPGVFRVVGSIPSFHQRALAATLWLGAHASHETAGRLLRLDGTWPDALHVVVPPTSRRGRGQSEVSVHRSVLARRDHRVVDGIACTSAARTLVDAAATIDEEALETALASARRFGLATLSGISRTLDDGGRRPGTASLRRVLAVAESRPLESRLEVKLARLLRECAFPPSHPQYPVGRHRLDRAWPERHVALEADGFEHHGQRLTWKRDRRRIAAIEAQGWRIVHVTWDDVVLHPSETLDRLAIALGSLAA